MLKTDEKILFFLKVSTMHRLNIKNITILIFITFQVHMNKFKGHFKILHSSH